MKIIFSRSTKGIILSHVNPDFDGPDFPGYDGERTRVEVIAELRKLTGIQQQEWTWPPAWVQFV